jgi:hypothetical protein
MLISTALLLDSNIRNSVCTPVKLPCRRVEVGYEKAVSNFVKLAANTNNNTLRSNQLQIGNSSEEKKN